MLNEKWLACNLQWFIPEHTCIPCREMIVLNPRVLQCLDQYYQCKHPYINFFQSNCASTKHHFSFLPCLARKSASLIGHPCSNSPTGALMLTGNLLFSVLKHEIHISSS